MSNYILCKSDNDCGLSIKQINNILYKRLLKNTIHNKFKYEINKETLEKELKLEIKTIDNTETLNIIPILGIDINQIEKYLDIYDDETDNLEEYCEYLGMMIYNQVNTNKYKLKLKLDYILETMSNYWDDTNKCSSYSLNDIFMKRYFNSSSNIIRLDGNLEKQEQDYLNDMFKEEKIDYNINLYYYINRNNTITNEEILLIYNNIPTEYLQYSFISNLLCTRTHCHLILNNQKLLEMASPIFEKYNIVFKYLIGYAWLSFTIEERINKKIRDDDKIVFDIDSANKLPIYPFSYDDINQNPYACILVDNKLMNLENNCTSMNMIKNYNKYYGVCDSKEFERRLKIFINGNEENGLLDLIDWNYSAITGSAMVACGMKYNPLYSIYKIDNNQDILTHSDLNNYYYHNYGDSDIDLLIKSNNFMNIDNNLEVKNGFLDIVERFVDNCIKYDTKTVIDNVHTASIIMSEELINYEIDNLKKILEKEDITSDYIFKNLDNSEIREYFYDKYYYPWKKEQCLKIKDKSIVYNEYLKAISKEEFRLYKLKYDIKEYEQSKLDYEKYIYLREIYKDNEIDSNKLICKLTESIRFKIKVPNKRVIEVFKAKNDNFMSTISNFHMSFVRAYWNGHTVKCLPSYITSMMIQLSTDYKYFASIRDPIDIINKYRSRGFGIILNNEEKKKMVTYNSEKSSNKDNIWIRIYNINLKKTSTIKSMFGSRKVNDNIFKLLKFTQNLPDDCYRLVNFETCNTADIAFSTIFNRKIPELVKYKCISNEGFIKPLERDIIKKAYCLINE